MRNSENKGLNEQILLMQLRKGNRMAFEQLYYSYARKLTAKLLQLVKSEEVAQDLLQDIFMKVWQMRDNIDINRSFGALLYTMASNLSFNAYRDAVREQNRRLAAYTKESYSHVEEELQYHETNQLLEKALSTLTERQRQVYVLHKLEGKSYKQIAELLQISHSAINQHLQLANKQIRVFMQSHLPHILIFLAPILLPK